MMKKLTMIMPKKINESGVKNAPLFSKFEIKNISQRANWVLGLLP